MSEQVHIVFAHSAYTGTSVVIDFWIDGSSDDHWLQEWVSADPEYIHNSIREYDFTNKSGIFHFTGKVRSFRSSWESTFDDDAEMIGEVVHIREVKGRV